MLRRLMETTTSETELLNRIHFKTCSHSETSNICSTTETIETTCHMENTFSLDQEEMVTLLRYILNERMTPVIAQQITTLENSFTLKMETLLIQRTKSMANSKTMYMDRLYDHLQQENSKLQIQVEDLTKELCSTVLASTPQHGH